MPVELNTEVEEQEELTTLKLRRGDSSDFFYDIELELETELDLTGWVGYLQIGTLKPFKVDDIEIESKTIYMSIPACITKQLRVGTYTGYLKLITPSGAVGTLEPIFNVEILPEVVNA